MCKAMEDMRDEAALAARLAERKEVASRLLKKVRCLLRRLLRFLSYL